MDKERLKKAILESNGRFFSVTFIKRSNGEERTMVCRTGVKKHLKGGELGYIPSEKELAVVFDQQKQGYRTIPLEAVLKCSLLPE